MKSWWDLRMTTVSPALAHDDIEKRTNLNLIYAALYAELRDKDSRQQQAVTWGITALAGGGMLTATLKDLQELSGLAAALLAVLLGSLTFVLHKIILSLARDRMSIARQLDRMHELMQVFEPKIYYKESSLFDPVWRGWGFDLKRDVNYRLSKLLLAVLWVEYVLLISLLFCRLITPP